MKPSLSARLPWQHLSQTLNGWVDRAGISRFDVGLIFFLAILVPAGLNYWLVANPFTVLMVLRWAVVVGLLLLAFRMVADSSPWYVRLALSMILGQVIFNYGFTNIVVGGGGIKFTLAELGVLIALLFLLPKTYVVLKQIPAFWVCMIALIVPPLIHLYPGIKMYGMSALRDILSVVDLIYFLAGLSVAACGLMMGRWLHWRARFIRIWMIAGVLYGCLAPFAAELQAVSPAFQSYQQTIPVVGWMLTASVNALAAISAWYAIPWAYPQAKWLRYPLVAFIMIGTLVAVGLTQSRNLYGMVLLLPFVLAYFGYRKAFTATAAGVVILVAALGLLEVFNVKVTGRISELTLSAAVDRFLSVSGKHGDEAGAHGVNQRLDWWASSLDKWSATPETVVLGVGYGPPLTNFRAPGGDYGEGVVVREPHNSYISSLSRGGVVYFALWMYVILVPLVAAAKGARLRMPLDANGHYRGVAAWCFIIMLMLLAQSLSEPHFETPSFAAMYYFVAGFALVEYLVIVGRVKVPGPLGGAT